MPTAVPPLVQLVGAVDCGPNTVNVIVPVAPLVAPESAELIEDAVIAEPSVPVEEALTVVVVVFPFRPSGAADLERDRPPSGA